MPINIQEIEQQNLHIIWSFVNPKMLFNRHLGLRSMSKQPFLNDIVKQAKELFQKVSSVKMIWQTLPASSDHDDILISHKRLTFPRQMNNEKLCLADYISKDDKVTMFAINAGDNIKLTCQALITNGDYLLAYTLQALALETAEAAAEYLHKRLRTENGTPDPLSLSLMDLFRAHYVGKRYSFGYPACPDLEMQKDLFDLLQPQVINLYLTDGYMMDPEAAVSGIVIYHPQAKYFSV